MIIALFLPIVSLLVFLYSYLWTDLAIILMTAETKPWIIDFFANQSKLAGDKILLSNLLILFVLVLTGLQIYLVYKKQNPGFLLKFLIFSSFIFAVSFPFLSKDLFSYLFGAKILWVYHQNPYMVIPETFRNIDLWLGFTHWTHREYVYGPIALLFSLIPMITFGASRFILIFFGYKILNWFVFVVTGLFLYKFYKNKSKVFFVWFLNPFLIFEFLINSHNDLLMISLFVISVVLAYTKKVLSFVFFVTSILTKFVSALFFPLLIIKNNQLPFLSKLLVLAMLMGFGVKLPQLQPWYYTWIYFTLPFANFRRISYVLIFLLQAFVLLIKYYPFVKTTFWDGVPQLEKFHFLAILIPLLVLLIEAKKIKKDLFSFVLNEKEGLIKQA